MNIHIIDKLAVLKKDNLIQISINDLKIGINDVGNHIVKLNNKKEIDFIIDKVCDHAGGRLIIKNGMGLCPMHGWQLNLDTLEYDASHICKAEIDYDLDEQQGLITINDPICILENPIKGETQKGVLNLRWLNHAAVYIECNGVSIVTDPWLFGPAFMTGWWLASPSPIESIDLLKGADYIYLSHNHPDHLHAETLSVLSKDKRFIIPNFKSKSVEKYLSSLGFHNIIVLDFLDIFEVTNNFHVSILKSGDFRDDSGLYIYANGHEVLLTVDANFLNSHILPMNIDLLMTSFAGGASGFPLCFNNYSSEEKSKILKRNKNSTKFSVQQYIQKTQPKYYMPYAGMFTESASRDKYINDNNQKNSFQDYKQICELNDTVLVYPNSERVLKFTDGNLQIMEHESKFLQREDTHFYINAMQKAYQYDASKIIEYLKKSKYFGSQVLQIIPTSDDFQNIQHSIVFADFKKQIFKTISQDEILIEKEGYKVMQMKVRPEVLMCVIENKLPWEDLSIGFQLRIERHPNEYESDFWYHFTNKYIGSENFRYSVFCGACTVFNQNPIWINENWLQESAKHQ